MQKQQIKTSLSPDFLKSGLEVAKAKKAFTLVELIIVITILAILATIAFLSFNNYTKSARDANRVSTLTNIQKGLDIYSVQVGRLPVPENPVIFTGGLNGNSLINQGILTQEILQTLSSTPVDPVTGKEYTYSTFGNGKYYQIAGNLETELSQKLGNQTYANTFQTAKLIGNYRYDPSLPSLIIGSGTTLFSPDTCFVVDGGTNTLENCSITKENLAGNISDSSLVGYWDMESLCNDTNCGETTNSGKLRDLSGNGNYGTFTGIISPNSTGGFVGSAYNFIDSNNGSIDIPSSPSLEIEKALTISVIIKANKNELKGILTKQSTGRDNDNGTGCSGYNNYCGYQLNTREDVIGGRVYNKFNPIDRSSVETFNYLNNYLILTYIVQNNENSKVYVNGILLNTRKKTFVEEISVSKNPLKIGRYWNDLNGGVYEFFDGIIDEVKIYNRALTDEEILQQARIAGF